MSRRGMEDGEQRKIRKKFWDLPFDVIALREDSDTPYIILDGEKEGTNAPIYLTDVQAIELIDRLGKALAILPSSK